MFITKESAEELLPPGLAGPGVHAWWNVFFPLTIPWFFVTYKSSDSRGQLSHHVVFLSEISHLIELSEVSGLSLTAVELVSPGYMNGTNKWKMSSLEEIWVSVNDDKNNSQEIHSFVLKDGTRYNYSMTDISDTKLTNQKLIFMMDY